MDVIKEYYDRYFRDEQISEVMYENFAREMQSDAGTKAFVLFMQKRANSEGVSRTHLYLRLLDEQVCETSYIQLYEPLYSTLLEMMYQEDMFNVSLCYKFSALLLQISNNNHEAVMQDIVLYSKKSCLHARTSIAAMYGNFDFMEIQHETLNNFFSIVYDCIRDPNVDTSTKTCFELYLVDRIKSFSPAWHEKFVEIL